MRKLIPFLSKSASFQIVSDLYLDIDNQYSRSEIPASAPYLILAGDVGKLVDFTEYLNFLEHLVPNFERIFLILGNHEFYGISIAEGYVKADLIVRSESLKNKVTLLNRLRYDILDAPITLIGCTLWSHIPPERQEVVLNTVQDFQEIQHWSLELHNQKHVRDLRWLRNQVKNIHNEKPGNAIIIVTHHAPCKNGTYNTEEVNEQLGSAFASDIVDVVEWPAVVLWVYGHTQFSNDFKRGKIRLVSNQRGYDPMALSGNLVPSEQFDIRKTVKI